MHELLPETDRAIAEAAARLVPRARAASGDAVYPLGAEAHPEAVPNGADASGGGSGLGAPSAHAPLTQTAPDEESEAE
ncbi:hypothetical protein GCM10009864_77160 [Streptomyces lunalinharesii]|uniref:Uncharacterized protein n=1 Tax=Streptomyces lunalinharesii TaxID=333384 RepID=A0ABP6FFB9_9ACTN